MVTPLTIKANATCEQPYQSLSNTSRSILKRYPPDNIDQTNNIMDTCFATAAFPFEVAIHCTIDISAGALVF